MADGERTLGTGSDGLSLGGSIPGDEQAVTELTDMILAGNNDEIIAYLQPFYTGTLGPKWAKQLLRDARDRAKAKIVRVHGLAIVRIDELTKGDEE
jgi:hypothetical protein